MEMVVSTVEAVRKEVEDKQCSSLTLDQCRWKGKRIVNLAIKDCSRSQGSPQEIHISIKTMDIRLRKEDIHSKDIRHSRIHGKRTGAMNMKTPQMQFKKTGLRISSIGKDPRVQQMNIIDQTKMSVTRSMI